jgi:predicted transcriptional regulator
MPAMIRREPRSQRRTGSQEFLPEAELEVLARLHELREAEVGEVRAALAPLRPLSHASVTTLLRRLEAKGRVSRRRGPVGKAFLYAPTTSATATYTSVVKRLLERVFANDPVTLVSSLVTAKAPTRRELAQLRRLVADLDRHAPSGRAR